MSDGRIELATADDIAHLQEIERDAARVFTEDDLPSELLDDVHELEFFGQAQASARLWVARIAPSEIPVGFAAASLVDGSAHLAEVDVARSHARQGLGRELVLAVADWARREGFPSSLLRRSATFPGMGRSTRASASWS